MLGAVTSSQLWPINAIIDRWLVLVGFIIATVAAVQRC
jgi:hypothetical protein